MSSSGIVNELRHLCSELRSEKVTNRNKAIDRLDTILTSLDSDVELHLGRKNDSMDVTWSEIFGCCIDAIIKHSVKLDESQDSKGITTMKNKNYIYSSVVTKIIDYSLDGNNGLSKASILEALFTGFGNRIVVKYFGITFLQMLENGIFKSTSNINEMKVNEFSRLISFIFEIKHGNDESLKIGIIRCLTKTIEIGVKCTQFYTDLVDYWPDIKTFCMDVSPTNEKAHFEVMKLYQITVTELSIDYHSVVCSYMLELLPNICSFYKCRMKPESKECLFSSILISLQVMYPNLTNGGFTTMNIDLDENWNKMLRKIVTITEMEIKEKKSLIYGIQASCSETFLRMAANVVYLVYWNGISTNSSDDDGSIRKRPKLAEKFDHVIDVIAAENGHGNSIWFSILNELLSQQGHLIDHSNLHQFITLILSESNYLTKPNCVRNLRKCCESILPKETELKNKSILKSDFCSDQWSKFVAAILGDTSSNNDIIPEKQLLIQQLIRHGKITGNDSSNLIQLYISSKAMRRNECIRTVREMLISNDKCYIEKSIELVTKTINWLYLTDGEIDAKTILLHLDPIDMELVANTAAIAVINFLYHTESVNSMAKNNEINHILLKYNRNYICLDGHGSEMEHVIKDTSQNETKHCLIQLNFEFLMRTLNYETSKHSSASAIGSDLNNLNIMIALMNSFMRYKIFNETDRQACPLIKRIGFFLNQIDFQLKQIDVKSAGRSDLQEIVEKLIIMLKGMHQFQIVKTVLDDQNLDGLIEFIRRFISFWLKGNDDEFDQDNSNSVYIARALEILVYLCGSGSHFPKTFQFIANYNYDVKKNVEHILKLIEIFCNQQPQQAASNWIVDRLFDISAQFNTDVKITAKVIDLLPKVLQYMKDDEGFRDDAVNVYLAYLKKSFKKSYSVSMVEKLIPIIKTVAKIKPDLLTDENFSVVCFQIAKFISSPSFVIQLATIDCVTTLMDASWLYGNQPVPVGYYTFCMDLYEHLDVDKILSNAKDTKCSEVAIQLFTSLFAFSTFHKKQSFLRLGDLCSNLDLHEADFQKFGDLAKYFKCSIDLLTRPVTEPLINMWIKNNLPVENFPWFLCSDSKHKFFKNNLSTFSYYILRNNPSDLNKLITLSGCSMEQLRKISISRCEAFYLPFKAGIDINSGTYKTDVKLLLSNLNRIGWDIKSSSNIDIQVITSLINHCDYKSEFVKYFQFEYFFDNEPECYLDMEAFKSCLNLYLTGDSLSSRSGPFGYILESHPRELLELFTVTKNRIHHSLFIDDKLVYLWRYCRLLDLTIDAFQVKSKKGHSDSVMKFFIRDIIVFLTNLMQEKNVSYQVQKATLMTFCFALQKIVSQADSSIKMYINVITRALIYVIENSKSPDIRHNGLKCLEFLLVTNSEFFDESIAIIDEFPDSEEYEKFRQIRKRYSKHMETGLGSDISNFLNDSSRGTEGLKGMKQNISTQSAQLKEIGAEPQSSNLLYKLIKRLMHIVRSDSNSVAIEAAKCLGEIGALKIEKITFYFETDTSLYMQSSHGSNASEYLATYIYEILDKLLLEYNSETISCIYDVCDNLVNSKVGRRLLTKFPNFHLFEQRNKKSSLDNMTSLSAIDLVGILKSTVNEPYENWISNFTSKIIDQFGWAGCKKLAEMDVSFSEAVLIPIFKVLIEDKNTHLQSVCDMLEYFFSETYTILSDEDQLSSNGTIFKEKRTIKYFLDICECIRLHNDWTVPINLLHVAKACIYCQAYFMAILYLEVWAISVSSTEIQTLHEPIFQDVAHKAYQEIGCTDAMSGFISPLNSRLEYLNLEGNWAEVLLELDGANAIQNPQFSNSMRRNGLLALLNATNSKFDSEIDYETCWRLGQWDISTELTSKLNSVTDFENAFQKFHYSALKSIHNKEELTARSAIADARHCVVAVLKEISIECIQSFYKYLAWLQLLQQAEDFCEIQFASASNVTDILSKWNTINSLNYGNFSCKHLVLAQRMSLIKSAGVRATRKINDFYKEENAIAQCLLDVIDDCKSAGEINLTIRYIAQLKNMELEPGFKAKAYLEDAKNCWKTGKSTMAMAILKELVNNHDFAFCLERVSALRIMGEYKAETNADEFDVLYSRHFKESFKNLNIFIDNREKISKQFPFLYKNFTKFDMDHKKEAYQSIAKYADKEYTQLNAHMNSEAFQMKVRIMTKNKQDSQTLMKSKDRDRDRVMGINVMRGFSNIDDTEIQKVESKKFDYLFLAVENYVNFCMVDNAITSPAVYRFISLWFANKEVEKLNEIIAKRMKDIPSYKFLCVLNQLTAQLNIKVKQFSDLVKDLLVRCAQEHPYHALYHLMALCFAHADNKTKPSNPDERVDIAVRIIEKSAKSAKKETKTCILEMKSMFAALIDFANKSTENVKVLTLNDAMKKLRNLNHIHCPTISLPISVTSNYDIISIRKWEEKVDLVGGINAPKKLMCICSDGRSRPQLLKGKDDLRQDAVMQQVLSMVNNLLRGDQETSEEKLLLRTYKVVPLSKRSGILEWCENTIPIGLYLAGNKKDGGAHKKYNPNDYTAIQCRTLMSEAHKAKKDPKTKQKVYLEICERFHPIFHYFFFEKFLVPGIWFERRLAYINSVATSSMVGYILGLGDRHVQNILIDEVTAEVIHIDFGIAFEQGKIMPTPETVPFRLTRDMLAPMGVCKAEGIFKKSCEKTMKILRKNQAVVMTILEVLLYDPLYIWNVCSNKVLGDEEEPDEKNLTAQRALLRVQAKLEGKDDGIIGSSSVEVQVQRLINEARNVRNLSVLYPGWDPFM